MLFARTFHHTVFVVFFFLFAPAVGIHFSRIELVFICTWYHNNAFQLFCCCCHCFCLFTSCLRLVYSFNVFTMESICQCGYFNTVVPFFCCFAAKIVDLDMFHSCTSSFRLNSRFLFVFLLTCSLYSRTLLTLFTLLILSTLLTFFLLYSRFFLLYSRFFTLLTIIWFYSRFFILLTLFFTLLTFFFLDFSHTSKSIVKKI